MQAIVRAEVDSRLGLSFCIRDILWIPSMESDIRWYSYM